MLFYDVQYWDNAEGCWRFRIVEDYKLDSILNNPNNERITYRPYDNKYPY